MKVWLLQASEPTPHDNRGSERLLRTGQIADRLCDIGHEVIWWASTFDHSTHTHRYPESRSVEVRPGYSIHYLHGHGYKRNISLSRLIDNATVAAEFNRLAPTEGSPDLLLASLPTVELARNGVAFGTAHNIPTVVDIRDLWPDAFYDVLPSVARPAIDLLTYPMQRALRQALSNASAIIAPAQAYVDWGISHAGRPATVQDTVFPMGYPKPTSASPRSKAARDFWRELGASWDPEALIVAFVGSLGSGFDFAPVIEAAGALRRENVKVQFVICGKGAQELALREAAAAAGNITFAGWVDAAQIAALLGIADIGLAPYQDWRVYQDCMGNKYGEYLSGGLPIAVGLSKGDACNFVRKHGCGFVYGGDDKLLAAELAALSTHPARLSQMKANAAAAFDGHMDASKVYSELLRYLEALGRGVS